MRDAKCCVACRVTIARHEPCLVMSTTAIGMRLQPAMVIVCTCCRRRRCRLLVDYGEGRNVREQKYGECFTHRNFKGFGLQQHSSSCFRLAKYGSVAATGQGSCIKSPSRLRRAIGIREHKDKLAIHFDNVVGPPATAGNACAQKLHPQCPAL